MSAWLHELVFNSAQRNADALAIKDGDKTWTYGELDAAANRLARALQGLGVGEGDRVGLWYAKSGETIAVMQAALRIGAVYVPIDPKSPLARAEKILRGCEAKALFTDNARAKQLMDDGLAGTGFLTADDGDAGTSWSQAMALDAGLVDTPERGDDQLAYILYTSGSTGDPKGVCISQRNALAYIEWAADDVKAVETDRFSSHAPFHFDLSVLDLYVTFLAGASVHLIPESAAYSPALLCEFMAQQKISVWYSVPSVLILMTRDADLLEREVPDLRVLIFAGEPYPIKHLRPLFSAWQPKGVRFLNYYGPTETNVCTSYEVHELDEDRITPVPIGGAASGDTAYVIDDDGKRIDEVGGEGQLIIEGPTVMLGYWGREPQNKNPYPTGDKVRILDGEQYEYIGRLDHMVKIRGHRVELGEIEAALADHETVSECAVVVAGEGMDKMLYAFLVSSGDERMGILTAKRQCADRVPRYMIVDRIAHLEALPRTRNGKVDRRNLTAQANEKI